MENLQEVFTLPSVPTGKTADYTYEMLFRYIHDNLLIFVKEESEFCKHFFSADFTGELFFPPILVADYQIVF